MVLSDEYLATIDGGALTASMLNALSRAISTIYDIGYALGSTLRRIFSKTTCSS